MSFLHRNRTFSLRYFNAMNRLGSRYRRLFIRHRNLFNTSYVRLQCQCSAMPCVRPNDGWLPAHSLQLAGIAYQHQFSLNKDTTTTEYVPQKYLQRLHPRSKTANTLFHPTLSSSSKSVMRYHFDDKNNNNYVVTDDWQLVCRHFKSIIDGLTEERRCNGFEMTIDFNDVCDSLIGAFASPYSYTADDIVVSRCLMDAWCISSGSSVFPKETLAVISVDNESDALSMYNHCPPVIFNEQVSSSRSGIGERQTTSMLGDSGCVATMWDWQGFSLQTMPNSLAVMEIPCIGPTAALVLSLANIDMDSRDRWNEARSPSWLLIVADPSVVYPCGELLMYVSELPMMFFDCYYGGHQLPLLSYFVSADFSQLRFGLGRRSLSEYEGTDARISPSGNQPQGQGLPNEDQLRVVQNSLSDNMPKLFITGHDYSAYTEDVIFENNWFIGSSNTTVGKFLYSVEVAKLRLFVHLRLANVRVQLLKTTVHVHNGTVRARWRIAGIPQSRAIMFWKFLPWATKDGSEEDEEWLDGFSTMFVDQNGLICKHRMDRMIPEEGHEHNAKPSLIEKLTRVATTPPAAAT